MEYWNPVGGELFMHSHIYESDSGAEWRGWNKALLSHNLDLTERLISIDRPEGTDREALRVAVLDWVSHHFTNHETPGEESEYRVIEGDESSRLTSA